MSALDQAFIKAYARDIPAGSMGADASQASVTVASRAQAIGAPGTAANAVEQMYLDGSLYRVDAVTPRHSAVPQPHFQLPPRTSPRRSVRRSVLRLASREKIEQPTSETTPPVLGSGRMARNLRQTIRQLRGMESRLRADLPPEVIVDDPAREPLPIKPGPEFEPTVRPLSVPANDPLNVVAPEALAQHYEVHASWADDLEAAIPSLFLLPLKHDWELTEHVPSWNHVEQQAVAEQPEEEEFLLAEAADDEFADHQLADDGAPAQHRWDEPQTRAFGRPHAKFKAAPEIDEDSLPAPATEPDVEVAKSCHPVWEVDKLQWPATCERLLTDKSCYFAQAGDKLLAAVRDGLKTLAVTGSRRGEGRTTLALCLARAAAKAGIQVAIVDADFTCPQLAPRLGLEPSHGWQDAALGRIPLSEAAVKSLSENITVLPLEPFSDGAGLSLADPRVTATIRAVAATFELVILDLGPLPATHEPLFPAGEASPIDAAIIVRDVRYASSIESQSLGDRLHEAGIDAVGIAENFVEPPQAAAA